MSSFILILSSHIPVGFPVLLQSEFRMPWWGWLLIFFVIVLVIFLLIRLGDKQEAAAEEESNILPPETSDLFPVDYSMPFGASLNPVDEGQPVDAVLDDLTIIEGIGPKINNFLQNAGITTFGQLAALKPDDLDRLLADANFGIADPATWTEQAELAARGDWDSLKSLQKTLKGGRRIM